MISVRDVPELRAVVLAFTHLDRDLKRDIAQATRSALNPIWRQEIKANLMGTRIMDSRVLGSGVSVKAGNPPVVKAATSRRAIGGRLRPAENWQAWEFGADQNKTSTYQRKSKNGGSHTVKRHASRHLPRPVKTGRVIYPAYAAAVPRLASLWVQTVVRRVHLAAEGSES